MKTSRLITAVILCAVPGLTQAGAPNSTTKATLMLERALSRTKNAPALRTEAGEEPTYTSVIVEITSPEAVETMKAMGCVIFGQRDELVLVCVPDDKVDDFMSLPELGEISVARPCTATCDVAREFTGAEAVQSPGYGGYDGTGIVLGLSDIGFDAKHAAFAGRVRRFSHFDDTKGTSFRIDTPEGMLEQGTDNPEQGHASMCANILGGAVGSSPYHGMAPGADLVIGTSTLHDCGLLAAVDEVIDYAKSVGKPAVVSISLANYTGPHDGTDLFSRYLEKQADEAAIAVSAGNEGVHTLSICHDFTDAAPIVTAALRPRSGGTKLNGHTDIWSMDGNTFGLTLEVRETASGRTVYTREITDGSTDTPLDLLILTDNDPDGFGKYFHGGGITVSTGIQHCNGRYAAVLTYLLETDHATNLPDYLLVLKVKGKEGCSVQMFADSTHSTFTDSGTEGFTPGNASVSVNNLATARNVLCVGSVTGQKSFTLDNGYSYTVSDYYPYNTASSFSGYALRLADGRSLPHIIAPGVGIMTAVSSYTNPTSGYSTTDASGHTSYWRADDGTSFSTPVTAGIIALWWQANPGLTPSQLREIAIATASKDLANPEDPRTGAGKIDALAGLRSALETEGATVWNVSINGDSATPVRIYVRNRDIVAESISGDVRLEVFTSSGRRTGTSNLPAGIYICRATAGTQTTTKRIVIK